MTTPLQTEPYLEQVKRWPPSGRHILAQFDDDTIIVYQAYKPAIAKAAVAAQNFHSDCVLSAGYSMTRMSWIKTNFLWMMYRADWAASKNQEHILAIRLKRSGFEELLTNAATRGEGQVRLQWDPDHTPLGEKVATGRRAIQLGIRGDMLAKLSREFVTAIYDITGFVKEQAQHRQSPEQLVTPKEHVYPCPDNIVTILAMNALE